VKMHHSFVLKRVMIAAVQKVSFITLKEMETFKSPTNGQVSTKINSMVVRFIVVMELLVIHSQVFMYQKIAGVSHGPLNLLHSTSLLKEIQKLNKTVQKVALSTLVLTKMVLRYLILSKWLNLVKSCLRLYLTKILPAPVAILNKIQYLVLRNNASVIDSDSMAVNNTTRTN